MDWSGEAVARRPYDPVAVCAPLFARRPGDRQRVYSAGDIGGTGTEAGAPPHAEAGATRVLAGGLS
jgi:hypothetical protein